MLTVLTLATFFIQYAVRDVSCQVEFRGFKTITSRNKDSTALCANGSGPLLDGNGQIYKCEGICPSGFDCEHYSQELADKDGICCPNLKELYQLYGEGDEIAPNSDSFIEQINIMESNDAPVKQIESQPLSSTLIRKKETKQEKLPNNKGVVTSEPYSCRRQQLEMYCENGRRQTQFVMRWYYRDGACLTYPWGYCPGEPVSSDQTLRTEEECQILCAKPMENVADFEIDLTDGEINASNTSSVIEIPDIKQISKTDVIPVGDPQTNRVEIIKDANNKFEAFFIRNVTLNESTFHNPPVRVHSIKTLTNTSTVMKDEDKNLNENSSKNGQFTFYTATEERPEVMKKCDRITPYRAMCYNSGTPSQFTLRWHLRGDKCELYPYGYCHGEFYEEPINSLEECIEFCVKNFARNKMPP